MIDLPVGSRIKVREPEPVVEDEGVAAPDAPAEPAPEPEPTPRPAPVVLDGGFWTGSIDARDMQEVGARVGELVGRRVIEASMVGESVTPLEITEMAMGIAVGATSLLVFTKYAQDAIATLRAVVDNHEHPTSENKQVAHDAVAGYIERNR